MSKGLYISVLLMFAALPVRAETLVNAPCDGLTVEVSTQCMRTQLEKSDRLLTNIVGSVKRAQKADDVSEAADATVASFRSYREYMGALTLAILEDSPIAQRDQYDRQWQMTMSLAEELLYMCSPHQELPMEIDLEKMDWCE